MDDVPVLKVYRARPGDSPAHRLRNIWVGLWIANIVYSSLYLIGLLVALLALPREIAGGGLVILWLVAAASMLIQWLLNVSQCIYWCSRTPGGLKGWRLGLLLGPFTSAIWILVETVRGMIHFTRKGDAARTRLIVLAILCIAPFTSYFSFYFYAAISIMLHNRAWRFERVPTSSSKRLLQFLLIFGFQLLAAIALAAGIAYLIWSLIKSGAFR